MRLGRWCVAHDCMIETNADQEREENYERAHRSYILLIEPCGSRKRRCLLRSALYFMRTFVINHFIEQNFAKVVLPLNKKDPT